MSFLDIKAKSIDNNIIMDRMLTILIAFFAAAAFGAVLYFLFRSGKNNSSNKLKSKKSRQTIIKEAEKRLMNDPHNVGALEDLSEVYYREQNWEKALPYLETLMNISAAHSEINLAEVSLRHAICCIKLNKPQDAYRGLIIARKENPESFDVNYYMGQAYLMGKEPEKAIPFLKKAIVLNHDIVEPYKDIGQAFYEMHRYKEALPYLKRTLDTTPESKELMYEIADCMSETGSVDKALKIFIHLRPDPQFGAKSCLAAGTIHQNLNQIENAIQDFEIGIKHVSAPSELLTNIRYRLAACFLKINDITQGLKTLKEISVVNPNYKDVNQLIQRYQELNQNKNLQTYLIGGNSDFVSLCRKIVLTYYKKSRVKIVNIVVMNEFTEVLTEIDTDKWQDSVIFRFYRTTGTIGELFIRDFHSKLKEVKAGKGICFTAGSYSEEARKYIDGRPIDLIEKSDLVRILSKLDSNLALQL